MKKYLILLILFSLMSCKDNPIPKPENDLGVEKMEAIFYDIAVLQAAQGYKSDKLMQNGIEVQSYIYKKHNIDSVTFVQNQHYYASEIKQYQKMYENVLKRLEEEKAIVDSLVKKNPPKKTKTPEMVRDSLKRKLQLNSENQKNQ